MATISFDPNDPHDVARAFSELFHFTDAAINGLRAEITTLGSVLKGLAIQEDIAVLENVSLAGKRVELLALVADNLQKLSADHGVGPYAVLELLAGRYAPEPPPRPKLTIVGGTDTKQAGKSD